MVYLGWEHGAVRLPGATGLRGGRIRAARALDGAGDAMKPPRQGLGERAAWEPSAKPSAALPGDLLRLPRAVREGLAGTVPHNPVQPAPRSRPRSLPGSPSQGTRFISARVWVTLEQGGC